MKVQIDPLSTPQEKPEAKLFIQTTYDNDTPFYTTPNVTRNAEWKKGAFDINVLGIEQVEQCQDKPEYFLMTAQRVKKWQTIIDKYTCC